MAVRADASRAIGSGHLMRCLTLADALGGSPVSFACRALPGHLGELIQQRGHQLRWLSETAAPWSPERDAVETARVLGEGWDLLVVDHYQLGADFERRMRPLAGRIVVLDDLANREHDCDLLLDQNLYRHSARRYAGKVPQSCQLLLGPHYALLRPEFRAVREAMPPRSGEIERLLVFFGGGDETNQTAKALAALAALHFPDLSADIVLGASNPHREAIASRVAGLPQVRLHVQVPHLAELMAQADLFLGAGGSTTWERCALGLPGVVVTVAPNQEEAMRVLAEQGVLIDLGPSDGVSAADLARELATLRQDPARVRSLGDQSRQLVDGLGARRVVEALRALA